MLLIHILVLVGIAVLISLIPQERWRNYLIISVSVLTLFWLQSSSPIRNLDFWLPLGTVSLTILVWLTFCKEVKKNDLFTIIMIAVIIVTVGLLRYIRPLCCITPTRPPQIWLISVVLLLIAIFYFFFKKGAVKYNFIITGLLFSLIVLVVVLKTPVLAQSSSKALRILMRQSATQASAFDIQWLGISYVFFRLFATLRDHQAGRLPKFILIEFINYVIFFPSILAGPIERPKHFLKSYQMEFQQSWENVFKALERILVGVFKKYALADTLALIALNDVNAVQTDSTLWLWVMLYAYAYRLYLDFAGYSDIVIGIAQLMGITLPENFQKPYSKRNLTDFWNSWHISLAMWFRAYYFNLISRKMISRWKQVPIPILIAISQITTMILVGVWHGITLNFFIWGVWHGVGLFVHNRWGNLTRMRLGWLEARPRLKRITDFASLAFVFHYVVLSWVWFALSDSTISWEVTRQLFGVH